MADCFERSWALAFCFVMFDQKDAMPMLVPAIVPHFFVAVPRKIFQEIGRTIQSKWEGARLQYTEIDPAKIVFHKNGFQYAANLRSGTGEKKCDSRLLQSLIEPMLEKTKADASQQQLPPFKPAPWDVKTGCETPLARLNEVFAAMLPIQAVLNKPVLPKPKSPAIPPRTTAHVEKPKLPLIPPRSGAVASQPKVTVARLLNLPR